MSLMDVIIVPDPVLRQEAKVVETINDDVAAILDNMAETMYESNGIGLAANQVALLKRVLVMDVPKGCWEYKGKDRHGIMQIGPSSQAKEQETQNLLQMVNPEIVQASELRSVYSEGCLSIPGQYAEVERPAKVTVKYIDKHGKEQVSDFEGLDSHCVQHEIDHLNGVLFVDYLSRLKRNTILRKVEKANKHTQLL